MSTDATQDLEESTATRPEERYRELTIGTEGVVIYDHDEDTAWVQSSVALPVEELR